MKTKVIIWRARDEGKSAETLLNEWLAENPEKRIVNVTQSEAGDVLATRRITYTIFYEDGAERQSVR